MSPLRAISCCLVLLSISSVAEARIWTTSQGRRFEAELQKMEGARALFVTRSGKRFTTAILDLSQADQRFLRQKAGGVVEELRSNFGRPWPREASGARGQGCKVVSADKAKSVYIYESPGYRFYSDSRITEDALDGFALVFESTRAYLAALPISMMRGETVSKKSRVLLFGTAAGYMRSGGMPGSAGCYMPRNRLVLIPMDSLGLIEGGTGFSRDMRRDDRVMVHELVHQLTPTAYYNHGAMGWFSEGLAEYVAATPYFNGTFRPDKHGNAVKEYVSGQGTKGMGRNLGEVIRAPHLREFMLMDYARFSGREANTNYGLGLLLTHYFFHMEDGGNARRVTTFLEGLQAGKSGDEALEPLLGGGGFEKLEQEISAAWVKKGIEIRFGG